MTQPIDSQSNQPSRCSRGNTTRWRPNPTTGRWVARLILTCTLAVGCGGGVELGSESDGGPTTTRDVRAGGTTVPPTTATATSLPEPTSSTGPICQKKRPTYPIPLKPPGVPICRVCRSDSPTRKAGPIRRPCGHRLESTPGRLTFQVRLQGKHEYRLIGIKVIHHST